MNIASPECPRGEAVCPDYGRLGRVEAYDPFLRLLFGPFNSADAATQILTAAFRQRG